MSEDNKIVDIDSTKEKKETKKRVTKLTKSAIEKEKNKVRKVKDFKVNVGGSEYSYSMDTESTQSKKDEFIQNIKAIVAYVATEEELAELSDEKTTILTSALIIAEIFRIYSSLEVGDTIEDRINFINEMSDIGVLEQVSDNIPEGIREIIDEADKEIKVIVEEFTEESKRINTAILELNKTLIDDNFNKE